MAKKSNRIINYFKDVKSELKKVVWPSFKQVKNNTLIVIVCILIIGIFISLFDALFDITLGKVIDRMQGGDEQTEETVDGSETSGDGASSDSALTEEQTLEFMKNYFAGYGITYDGEKFTDENGNELTEEEANAIVEAANAKNAEGTDNADNTETNGTADNGAKGE